MGELLVAFQLIVKRDVAQVLDAPRDINPQLRWRGLTALCGCLSLLFSARMSVKYDTTNRLDSATSTKHFNH